MKVRETFQYLAKNDLWPAASISRDIEEGKSEQRVLGNRLPQLVEKIFNVAFTHVNLFFPTSVDVLVAFADLRFALGIPALPRNMCLESSAAHSSQQKA
jgi:hypothetical protein